MQKFIEVSGKSESEALEKALHQLNLSRDEVSLEVVERAKSGFLGIGSSPAVVRVHYEEKESVSREASKAPVAPAEAAPRANNSRKQSAPKAEKPRKETAKQDTYAKAEEKADSLSDNTSEHAKMAKDFLGGLLERMGISAEISVIKKEENTVLIELSGDNMGAVIGRRGETLDAIQHLTNYTVNRGAEERTRISVDAENYRSKREDALVRLAYKMADKTLKYKRSMSLEPMNSYERHIIHSALQNYEGVTTGSTGAEPNRRVVISCEKTNNS